MKNSGNSGLLVMVGPKLIGDYYYRIVSHHGSPYRVERFEPSRGSWCPAPKNVRFNDVCNAPEPTQWLQGILRRTRPGAV